MTQVSVCRDLCPQLIQESFDKKVGLSGQSTIESSQMTRDLTIHFFVSITWFKWLRRRSSICGPVSRALGTRVTSRGWILSQLGIREVWRRQWGWVSVMLVDAGDWEGSVQLLEGCLFWICGGTAK